VARAVGDDPVSELSEEFILVKYPRFATMIGQSPRTLGKIEAAQREDPTLSPRLPKPIIQGGRKFVRLADAKSYINELARHSEGVRLRYHGDKSRVAESV
jgi:hypothetical protein